MSKRQKILIITDDTLGQRMAGPAIRAWNMADALADRHDVRLASTRKAEVSSPRFAVCDGAPWVLPGLASGQDIIVTQGYTLLHRPWLAHTGARMVIDVYDPIHLENLEGQNDLPLAERQMHLTAALDSLALQMKVGDFFVCASDKQRDLWLGYLSGAGRINLATYGQDSSLRKLIDLAPFGIDPAPPPVERVIKGVMPGIAEDDIVLLWAGGVYNWFDPVTLVHAVGDLAERFPQLKLVFLGTKHPSLDDLSTVVLRQAIDVADERGLTGRHVFFREGWVPYDERGKYLTDADIGVSTHFLHAETAFSFRTRMLDYLWAGLPIICTEGDEFARVVQQENLGAVVGAQDRQGLADAIAALVADPRARAAAAAASRSVATRYHWRTALAPLIAYCDDPWRAADLTTGGAPTRLVRRWRSRFDRRFSHAREYLRVHGSRQFLRRLREKAGQTVRRSR